MDVRSVVTLKQGFGTLDSARQYVQKIKDGNGKYRKASLAIHYNFRKHMGKWSVVALDTEKIPGGTPCVQCRKKHFSMDDYLCPSCREQADP